MEYHLTHSDEAKCLELSAASQYSLPEVSVAQSFHLTSPCLQSKQKLIKEPFSPTLKLHMPHVCDPYSLPRAGDDSGGSGGGGQTG